MSTRDGQVLPPELPDQSDARTGVQSLEHGLTVLSAMGELGEPVALAAVARACGMSRVKAYRYLVSLERCGFVERDALAARYRLSGSAIKVGLAALHQVDFVRTGSAALTALCTEIHESGFLSIWGEHGPVIVRWEDVGQPVTVNVRVGSIMPLLTSATGLVYAGFMPDELVTPIWRRELAQQPAQRAGIRSAADVKALLDEVRRRGIGQAMGRMLAGVEALAVPVFGHDRKLAGAITCLGLADTFDGNPDGRIARALISVAKKVSSALGHVNGERAST